MYYHSFYHTLLVRKNEPVVSSGDLGLFGKGGLCIEPLSLFIKTGLGHETLTSLVTFLI